MKPQSFFCRAVLRAVSLLTLTLLSLSLCPAPTRAAGDSRPHHGRVEDRAAGDSRADGGAGLHPGYRPAAWVKAQVPGTVFGSYVQAGLEKEPTYADNIYKVDKAKYDRNFWYRTEFTAPASYRAGRVWLNFDGVNRDADVYVNGKSVGGMRGFMQRGRFDVTGVVHPGGRNALAVLDPCPFSP